MTKYRVLRYIGDVGIDSAAQYEVACESVEAHGPVSAIRKAAEAEFSGDSKVYVAVPLSNWTEEPVSIEEQPPRLRVGAATPAVARQTAIEDHPRIDDALMPEINAGVAS